MRDLMTDLFGEYHANSYIYETGDTFAEVIPSGLAGVDIPYVLGGVVFSICLVYFFRFLLALLRK